MSTTDIIYQTFVEWPVDDFCKQLIRLQKQFNFDDPYQDCVAPDRLSLDLYKNYADIKYLKLKQRRLTKVHTYLPLEGTLDRVFIDEYKVYAISERYGIFRIREYNEQ